MRIHRTMVTVLAGILVLAAPALAEGSALGKGSTILSGSFSFSSAGGDLYESENSRLTTVHFDPSVGLFVIDGLAVGARFSIDRTSQARDAFTSLAIGPQVAYFFGAAGESTGARGSNYPYLALSLLFARETISSGAFSLGANGMELRLGGGVMHMLSGSVGLFGEISYAIESMTGNSATSSGNLVSLAAGFSIFLSPKAGASER